MNSDVKKLLLKLHQPNLKSIPEDCPTHSCTYLHKKDILELKKNGIKFKPNMNIDYLLIYDLNIIEKIFENIN